MAQVVYPFNPFNDNDNCIVTETFNLTATNNIYFPRAAPFFFGKLEVYANATINPDGTITGTKLTPGQHFAVGNSFKEFILKYKKNVFSSIIIPVPNNGTYVIRYSTVGGKLVLDEAAYAELVANKMNHDREAYWDDFVDVPTEWDPDPHEHPINMIYTVEDMWVELRMLLTIKTQDPNNTTSLLSNHIHADLKTAHKADASMVGLDKVPNIPAATVDDIGGQDPNKLVTLAVAMEMFKRMANGELNLS